MSHPTLRFLIGTARLRVRERFRLLRGRTRRRPHSAAVAPRPAQLRRGSPSLALEAALLACDLNPRYLDAWPLARRAWRDVVGLDPLLVLVAEPDRVPATLRDDAGVAVFPPLPGIHTALQAQCIRLLYPAVLGCAGGVVVSDVDMAPLAPGYFRRPAGQIPARHFVSYRDVLLGLGEIPVCYNAALPGTWADVFGVRTEADVRDRLRQWTHGVDYTGEHGGTGWVSDQRILHDTLLGHGRRTSTVWILDDYYTRFRRLERTALVKWGGLDETQRRLIASGAYSDFHFPLPYPDFRKLADEVVDLAAEGASRARPAAARSSRARARPSSSS